MKEFLTRAFKRDALKRLFSVARFYAMLAGVAVASVFFLTNSNLFAAIVFAVVAFILYRYGEIKGYITRR